MTMLKIPKRLSWAKYKPGEGYRLIDNNDGMSMTFCVMCGQPAKVIAPETEEPLCLYCVQCNDEARRKK